MEHFYDGQIRRYVNQIVRALSGFKYKSADGKLTTIPVTYGDMTRQVASIVRDNSENKIPSAPRMAVYITGLQLDRSRLGDSTLVSKIHIRERKQELDADGEFVEYTQAQGHNYTVERLMPTPYKLTVKADIWSTNTDQKLQMMEQIMMLFNPSLELQTTDNYIDWTSLSVLELTDIVFSSRSIPVGQESEIDIGTMTFEAPIWISPPSKVKRLGVVHNIVMNIFDDLDNSNPFRTELLNLSTSVGNVGGFGIFVYYNKPTEQYFAELIDPRETAEALCQCSNMTVEELGQINWFKVLDLFEGKYRAGSSQIFLTQASGNEIVGTIAVSAVDPTKLIIQFDQDTYPTNTVLVGPIGTRGTVDAIVDPQNQGPDAANWRWNKLDENTSRGTRYLLINDIGDGINDDGADAWKNRDRSDLIARANDIIEWDGRRWHRLMDSSNVDETVYITNIRTGVQYKYENGEWTKSVEGEYPKGRWQLVL